MQTQAKDEGWRNGGLPENTVIPWNHSTCRESMHTLGEHEKYTQKDRQRFVKEYITKDMNDLHKNR